MNDIARKAGYFVDIIKNKKENKIYINCGKQCFLNKDKEKNMQLTINNGLIKLTDDQDNLIKVLDITKIIGDKTPWDYMSEVCDIFVSKIVENVDLDKSFIYTTESN